MPDIPYQFKQGKYSVDERDAFFDRIAEYPDAADGSAGQVPTVQDDGTIAFNTPASGGQPQIVYRQITLAAANWSNSTQTVTVTGVSATETDQLIQPVPASASRSAYQAAGVQATAQAANSLTFTCTETPSSDLTVYVCLTELEAAT